MRLDIHITYGPAIQSAGILEELLSVGISAVRFNMSHTDCEKIAPIIKSIRDFNPEIKIGADLRGRKLRIGPLPGGVVHLRDGDFFKFIPMEGEALIGEGVASVNYPLMGVSVSVGDFVLLDDGALRLRVREIKSGEVLCIVERGGMLTERSGLNIPGHAHNMSALTEKDYWDIDGLRDIDHLYLSYVESGDDIDMLRMEAKKRGIVVPIIAKVELIQAVNNIREIAAKSDGVCIARGDLGVEVSHVRILDTQRYIVRHCRYAKTPVLLAGEVLFSMVSRGVPYRAEVTDVVVALEQGVDGFILSDETAIGCDPVNAVKYLNTLISGFYSNCLALSIGK